LKTERFKTKPLEEKRQLLFKGAGVASTLHSYVPTIIFKEQF
jgi:hypothetical protein